MQINCNSEDWLVRLDIIEASTNENFEWFKKEKHLEWKKKIKKPSSGLFKIQEITESVDYNEKDHKRISEILPWWRRGWASPWLAF